MVDDRDPDDGEREAGSGSASSEPEFGSSEWLLQQLSGGRLTGAERGETGPADADADTDADAVAADSERAQTQPVAYDPQFGQPETVALPVTPAPDEQVHDEPAPAAPAPAAVPAEPVADHPATTPAESPDAASGPAAAAPAGFVWNLTPGVGSDPLVEQTEPHDEAVAESHDAVAPSGELGGLFAAGAAHGHEPADLSAPPTPAAPDVPAAPDARPAADTAPPAPAAPSASEPPSFFEALRMPEPPSWDIIAPAAVAITPTDAADGDVAETPAAPAGDDALRRPRPSSWNPFAPAPETSQASEPPVEPTTTGATFFEPVAPPPPAEPPVGPAAEPPVAAAPTSPAPTSPPPVAPEAPSAVTPPVFPQASDAQPTERRSHAATPERTPEESAFFTRPVDAVPPAPRPNPFEPVPPPVTGAVPVQPQPSDRAEPGPDDGSAEGHGLAALLGFFDEEADGGDDAATPPTPTSRSVIGDTTGIIPLPSPDAPGAAAATTGTPDAAPLTDPGSRDGLPSPFGAAPYGSGAPPAAAPLSSPPVLPPADVDALLAPTGDDTTSGADTPTTKLDTHEIAALLAARTGDPEPVDAAAPDAPAPAAQPVTPESAAVPLEDATLRMGALPSPATQPLDAESLADVSEPPTSSTATADALLFAERAPTGATTVLPAATAATAATAAAAATAEPAATAVPTGPGIGGGGGEGGGRSGSGSAAGGQERTNRLLFLIAGGLAIVLVLIGLFALGTRLPSLFGGPAAQPIASATTTPKTTPTHRTTPTPTPKPTVQPKPAGPQPAGAHAWNTLGGGECIQPYSTPWAETYTVVDCASPHAGQMVYTNLFSADPAAPYPGADALAKQINALCTRPGVLDLGAAAAYPNLQVQGAFPATEQQWKGGQRSYYCFASRAGGEPMTSSVAGPGPTG